jgi:hypothetical protein
MKRYGTSIAVMIIILVGLIFAVGATSSWSTSAENLVKTTDAAKMQAKAREQLAQDRLQAAARVWPAIKAFNKVWEPHVKPFPAAKDFAQAAMALLERDAQASGVGSSQKTLPPVGPYRLGTRTLQVQKFSLTATGELMHCLAWLGAIQEHLPYSRVESFTLSGFGSSSSSLQVTVALPVVESASAASAATKPAITDK